MAKRPRIADVAAAAGVSTATVSMVLNGTGGRRIGAETSHRVRQAAESLGYRPNSVARGLRTRRTQMIGFIGDDVATTPFAGQMIRGAHDAAKDAGHLLLMTDTGGDPGEIAEAVEALQQRQTDGLVIATMYHQVVELPESAAALPHVLLNSRPARGGCSWTAPDEKGGSEAVLSELTALGHTRIAHLTTAEDVPAKHLRAETWRDLAGPEAADLYREVPSASTPHGYAGALELLRRADRPTAVFCFNDRMAMGLYRAAAELGLSLPDDLSVVSYDDQELIAPALHPGLTSAALPHYDMGRWAVEELLRRMSEPGAEPAGRLMPCPVARRDSTAPPA
ncbi:LacI family DNA-binding transcriptional regulator [Salininema proteolyticum]|uniref:LacI family DNA-binding transcriptional regulator n=1 Tax=Salininema proteolyticum TaxID=1607685 RepID=A0ABV8U2V1_9ACTN